MKRLKNTRENSIISVDNPMMSTHLQLSMKVYSSFHFLNFKIYETWFGKDDRRYRKFCYDKQLNRQRVCSPENRRLNRLLWWRLVKSWMVWKQRRAHRLGAITISSNVVNWQVLKKKTGITFPYKKLLHWWSNWYKMWMPKPSREFKRSIRKLMQVRVILHKETEIH